MGSFGTSEILIYVGGTIVMMVTIYMAISRRKRDDDEDITD
ncbi:hypothetical protein [Mucilaginibacter sp.]